MAFKMKGSTFYGKGNQSPTKHFVDDVKEHNDGHPDSLQTPKEHAEYKKKGQSPNKAGILGAVGGIDQALKGVHSIKGTADEITGKAHVKRAMNQPISKEASGGLTKKEEEGGGAR